jgi:hypothetical protein
MTKTKHEQYTVLPYCLIGFALLVPGKRALHASSITRHFETLSISGKMTVMPETLA